MGFLRFYLASCVFVWHHIAALKNQHRFMYSFAAVLCFYIISGFYMSLILHEKYGPDRPGAFYLNRALRLYPAYLVILSGAVTLVWTGVIPAEQVHYEVVRSWLHQVVVLPGVT